MHVAAPTFLKAGMRGKRFQSPPPTPPSIELIFDNFQGEMTAQRVADLRKSDSGLYTCKATSETGQSTWNAYLVVEASSNPRVIFHRTPEPSAFPGPPTKPDVLDITETSVRLSWRANSNHGASPVVAFTVEYFSHETGQVMLPDDTVQVCHPVSYTHLTLPTNREV